MNRLDVVCIKKFSHPYMAGLFLLAIGMMGCRGDELSQQVSNIPLDSRLYRMDERMKRAMEHRDSLGLYIRQKPAAWRIVLKEIIGLKGNFDSLDDVFMQEWGALSRDTVFRMLTHKIDSIYRDFTSYYQEIYRALQYYRYYFPDREVPDIYTANTNLGVAQFIFEDSKGKDAIGIGLDFYLGGSFPYERLRTVNTLFSEYLTRHFHSSFIVRDCIWALTDELLGEPPGQRMMDIMIHEGKRLYIIEKLLPDTPDSIIIKYTARQIKWCEENIRDIWSFFLAGELLYEIRYQRIRSYVDDAPFSVNMPKEAPSRTANWIGWQIVKEFMRRHPDVSLDSLIRLKDAEYILRMSKFKP